MKKTIVLLAVLVVAAASATAIDLSVGANAYYASAIQPSDVRDARPGGLAASDFAFGGEARLFIGSLTGSAVAVFMPGSDFQSPQFRVMTDAGLSIQVAILRAGLGIGPDFGVSLGGSTSAARLGGNLRATADLVLGDFSVGLSWFSLISFDRASIADAFRNPYGFLGVTLLKSL